VCHTIVAFTPIVGALARQWIREDPITGTPDAVVVLSAGGTIDSSLYVDSRDRLIRGLEVAKATQSPILVTMRTSVTVRRVLVTTDVGQRELVRLAEFSGEWIVVDSVHDTAGEARGAAALLFPRNARRVAVVTSPMHSRRACAIFEATGFSVTCVAARSSTFAARSPTDSEERLAAFQQYLYERLGMIEWRLTH
jgi:uncharacterized SAM-binding protein YcdF (DUF218 family)